MHGKLIQESPEKNPFLDAFYRDPELYGLPTQLQFLMNRRESLRYMAENLQESAVWVSDFLFAKDRLFAGLTLDAPQYDLYNTCLLYTSPSPRDS